MVSISFEKINVLDSNFIHRYTIIKCGSSSIKGKIHQLFLELWPFFTFERWFPFHTFEKISELDSYFIHKHIIIKYRSSLI